MIAREPHEGSRLVGTAVRAGLALCVVAALALVAPASVAVARAQAPASPPIDEEAGAALARMSKTLLASQFSFDARTFRSYAGPNGEMLHIAHRMKTIVRRPDRVSIAVSGDDGSINLLYDGKAVVIYGVEQKMYASIPAAGTIDKVLDTVQERTGTDFPLADLLSDDPKDSVLAGVTSARQVGTSTIDGVSCRHFFLVQAQDMEFELWLEDNERSLPRRLVVTYRSLPGRPVMIAELSNWDLSIAAADSTFEFVPPAGVTQVELVARTAPSDGN
jgi:hypothetical protein